MSTKLVSAYRIVTFVPPDHLDKILATVQLSNPLQYGHYTGVCWHSAPGVEMFVPETAAHPTEGKAGTQSTCPSIRLEFSIPRNEEELQKMLDCLTGIHPWEEPVILISEILETRRT
ncbi:MAG: hypothetical protein UY76_C0045G0006 [Candidatus Uhrbacteria bacterium GW2011_GWA2_52_8d]|uniref:Uncharacterized protein n=1 Tax=Candidatus Uhrbacteria bacterium GW2011_GWA2_52_8d TaxID=1618979 RepID=A0A0G1XM72_9BACT|nr:MAG: hypothetical protein UY76_C0045G0006 [Candidatus Uhrbacteria bacterium GW2011_GWA2_52_8d]